MEHYRKRGARVHVRVPTAKKKNQFSGVTFPGPYSVTLTSYVAINRLSTLAVDGRVSEKPFPSRARLSIKCITWKSPIRNCKEDWVDKELQIADRADFAKAGCGGNIDLFIQRPQIESFLPSRKAFWLSFLLSVHSRKFGRNCDPEILVFTKRCLSL